MGTNELTGPIPAELGNLAELVYLSFGQSNLSGAIPSELGRLTKLRILDLTGNQLNGPIPPELGALGSVTFLSLDGNGLTGAIPQELGNLKTVQQLWLSRNGLTGEIPHELAGLDSVKGLLLNMNELEGEIPSELSQLESLEYLDLSGNVLSGEIPPAIGNLGNLTFLNLAENALQGPLPATFGGLGKLENLLVWDNQLSGMLPAELGALAQLRSLIVSHNAELRGFVPRTYLGMELDDLILHETGLCVPPDPDFEAWIGTVGSLSDNRRCDDADEKDFAALVELHRLAGGESWTDATNWLNPDSLATWHGVTIDTGGRVTRLELADNGLAGDLPEPVFYLTALTVLNLADNGNLGGALPSLAITTLTLDELDLGGTGVCVPVGVLFDTWLGGISKRVAARCSGRGRNDGR